MGSKTALLRGTLGRIVEEESREADRFVDLFTGSGSVAHYVAERVPVPVLAIDQQKYSKFLAGAVIERTSKLDGSKLQREWIRPALVNLDDLVDHYFGAARLDVSAPSRSSVHAVRALAEKLPEAYFVTTHYAGHYFSPRQALQLDLLLQGLPSRGVSRLVATASLIRAASTCAASPGHTAQPFQPTPTLLRHISIAWSRDLAVESAREASALANRHAQTKGHAVTSSAEATISSLKREDLVFLDPPYSAAQYSRFYHVLEGVAQGGWDAVSGAGRAPIRNSRASSDFSMKSKSAEAMQTLLSGMREVGCRAIITFPNAEASNGLSAKSISELASPKWRVTTTLVASSHSTLGGSSAASGRGGRRELKEAVIQLTPR